MIVMYLNATNCNLSITSHMTGVREKVFPLTICPACNSFVMVKSTSCDTLKATGFMSLAHERSDIPVYTDVRNSARLLLWKNLIIICDKIWFFIFSLSYRSFGFLFAYSLIPLFSTPPPPSFPPPPPLSWFPALRLFSPLFSFRCSSLFYLPSLAHLLHVKQG